MREWKDYDDGLDYEDLISRPADKNKSTQENPQPITRQVRAAIAGTYPVWIFTAVSVLTIVVLAAVLYKTAYDDIGVNVDKVDTARVELSGSDDFTKRSIIV